MQNTAIYLFPFIINIAFGILIFVGPMRAVENGENLSAISLMITGYGIGYVLSSMWMGKIVRVRYAKWQVIGAALLIACFCSILVFVDDILASIVIYTLFPGGTALFFNAFQTFMKDVESTRSSSMSLSVGRYICAFGLGFACGPFISGWIREYLQWNIAFVIAAMLALMVAALALFLNPKRRSQTIIPESGATGDKPDLALAGWIGSFVGSAVMSLYLTLFPEHSEAMNLSPVFRGSIIFLMGILQGLVALFYGKTRYWMYRYDVVPVLNLFGIVSLVVLYFLVDPRLFYFVSLCLGVFAASFFFIAIYHSVSHPSKSVQNIAVNETVIGLGFLVGPQFIRLIPDGLGFKSAYLFAIFPLVLVMVFQFAIIKKKHRNHSL